MLSINQKELDNKSELLSYKCISFYFFLHKGTLLDKNSFQWE